jgi:hypothetical protein
MSLFELKMITRAGTLAAILLLFGNLSALAASPTTATVFSGNVIHFTPDDSTKYDTDHVFAQDNGRVMRREVILPRTDRPVKIMAHLAVIPIPLDEQSVCDRWDRAGNIRLAGVDGPDIEIIKFVTAYGGRTEYTVDVSYLAPLLTGKCVIKSFIDTWVSPGWKIDLALEYIDSSETVNPDWAQGILFEQSFDAELMDKGGITARVTIPEGLNRVKLHYLVSGHCTDGRGADEFEPKDNVISVDGTVVYRFQPWRDDCKNFRALNPYCKKWSDGYWSSDYSRSGWCPGDMVSPVELDLTDHLTPGPHTVRFTIENIRPKDDDGHFGYWRVSGHLLGWK